MKTPQERAIESLDHLQESIESDTVKQDYGTQGVDFVLSSVREVLQNSKDQV